MRPTLTTLILCALSLLCTLSVHADDWMARLADNTYLDQLSIPGTHDSATGHGFNGLGALFGSTYALTQEKTITQQWDSGIRAFDLRPCVADGELRINHGIMETKLTMQQALLTLCNLLNDHPTETAFVLMRHEEDADGGDETWNTLIVNLWQEEWVQRHAIDFRPTLTVGEVRGKLLLISRNNYAQKPIMGAFVSRWSHDTNRNQQYMQLIGTNSRATCYAQDFYECTGNEGKAKKTETIMNLLKFSTTRTTTSRMYFINHTSGYSLTTSFFGNEVSTTNGYRDNAATQNQAVIDYLSDKSHAGPTGLVMMDFAGVDHSGNYDVKGLELTKILIENNFNFTPQGDISTSITTIPDVSPAGDPSLVNESQAGSSASSATPETIITLSGHPATEKTKGIVISKGHLKVLHFSR